MACLSRDINGKEQSMTPDHREPMAQALEMASALLRLLNELADDDPGDNEARVAPRLLRAQKHAQNLVLELKEVVR
jgi:hypothetical protein